MGDLMRRVRHKAEGRPRLRWAAAVPGNRGIITNGRSEVPSGSERPMRYLQKVARHVCGYVGTHREGGVPVGACLMASGP